MEGTGWGTLRVWEKWEMPTGVCTELFKARKLVDTSRHMVGLIEITFI